MNCPKLIKSLISIVGAIAFLTSPIAAQQRRSTAPKKSSAPIVEPTPTFDTLLSAESYKIYCEVRDVGGLIHSSAVNDLLDPVMKLAAPPKEFKTIVKWLNAHADLLAGSRMMVASWPSRPKLPGVLVAIEFASVEEARKFYPQLRGFLPTLVPTPSPTAAGPGSHTPESPNAAAPTIQEKESAPVLPPYQMQLAGSLVLVSDTSFTFRALRPRNSKPLEEDPSFTLARNRFASESLFLYLDVKTIDKEEKERRQKWEEEEQKRIESEAANSTKAETLPDNTDAQMNEPPPVEVSASEPPTDMPSQPEPVSVQTGSPQATSADSQMTTTATLPSSPQRGTDELSPLIFTLYGGLFGGQPKWPEAVAAGIAFEGDAYVLRALILNSEENKASAIPFVPQFVSGPPLVPESPNILPADADLFVSVSLDYPQIYDGIVKANASAEEFSRKQARQPVTASDTRPRESPFAPYERKLGLKIKSDLLPLLGNELALALPRKTSPASPGPASQNAEQPEAQKSEQTNVRPPEPSPVIAISVKDREAVRKLIPKIIESLAFKGADLFAQTEQAGDAEITSYANILSYAFIGDFLVVSADAGATRHVVDSYLEHQTLSSNSHFRNFTHWQPRQVLGQVYVAPSLIEQYRPGGASTGLFANDKLGEFVLGVNPLIDPLTYALSNDGSGPLHELRVPRNLLMVMIAGMSSRSNQSTLVTNEAVARSAVQLVASAEASFQSTKGDGRRYGTLDELVSEGLVTTEMLQKYGYKIEVAVSGNKFEVTAVPAEYGKTGRLSYFVDESGVLRGGDHGGGAATISDKQIQ